MSFSYETPKADPNAAPRSESYETPKPTGYEIPNYNQNATQNTQAYRVPNNVAVPIQKSNVVAGLLAIFFRWLRYTQILFRVCAGRCHYASGDPSWRNHFYWSCNYVRCRFD